MIVRVALSVLHLYPLHVLILFVAMDKERLEAAEAERSIAEFSRKKETLMEHRQNLLKEIEQTRQAIQKKRERNPNHSPPWLSFRTLFRKASSCGTGVQKWTRAYFLGGTSGNETGRG